MRKHSRSRRTCGAPRQNMYFLIQPTGSERLGDWLNSNLAGDWAEFRAAVAFVKRSGVTHIAGGLAEFAQSKRVEIVVGVDHQGTSYEGLKELLNSTLPNGRVVVVHNRLPHTFHPKVYLFKSPESAEFVIGSGNLTQGGLYTNYEAGLQVSLDLREETHRGLLQRIEGVLDVWADERSGTSWELSDSRLEALVTAGLVPKEADMITATPGDGGEASLGTQTDHGGVEVHFGAVAVPSAPPAVPSNIVAGTGSQVSGRYFVMTLQKTDVGVGQTTAGTSRRSPEIFVPLKARNMQPEFWNWQDGFEEDPGRLGKFDRKGVRMRVGYAVVEVNMMTWPVKHDFRLRSEALRSMGSISDILVMEKVDDEAFDYDVSVTTVDAPEYEVMRAKCDQSVQNSEKRFGYF